MGGTYHKERDNFVANLGLLDTGTYRLDKYGRMRRRYLKENRPALYNFMSLRGTPYLTSPPSRIMPNG